MTRSDFPALGTLSTAQGQVLYRVQWSVPDKASIQRGAVRLRGGSRTGRFDLAHGLSAYFAARPQTALHEAVYRKDLLELSTRGVASRELIAVAITQPMALADLRPYSSHFPVLQSARIQETQELADDLHRLGFDGLICRSAQQDGHDCVVLFDPGAELFRLLWRSPLSKRNGTGHAWSAVADQGARIPAKP